jgi:hypothetical protein
MPGEFEFENGLETYIANNTELWESGQDWELVHKGFNGISDWRQRSGANDVYPITSLKYCADRCPGLNNPTLFSPSFALVPNTTSLDTVTSHN